MMAKPNYFAECPHCFFYGHSHQSQEDADRAVRNHVQMCENNPANYSWQDADDAQRAEAKAGVATRKGCALIGLLLLPLPPAILYGLIEFLG